MPEPFIKAASVTKQFGGPTGTIALADITADIGEGEFVSLLGPSGCGKSTFLRCLAGLDHPTGGALTLAGAQISKPPVGMGIALQRDALLDWMDVLANVLLPADFGGFPKAKYGARAVELLTMVGLQDFIHAYPASLSGGMRQRVAICRALLLSPKLLVMDEPFGALDSLTRDQLNVDLHRLWLAQRMTVVFVTHSITEALFLSTRVLMFGPRPGRIVDDVTLDLPEHRMLDMRETPEFGVYARRMRRSFEAMGLIRE